MLNNDVNAQVSDTTVMPRSTEARHQKIKTNGKEFIDSRVPQKLKPLKNPRKRF